MKRRIFAVNSFAFSYVNWYTDVPEVMQMNGSNGTAFRPIRLRMRSMYTSFLLVLLICALILHMAYVAQAVSTVRAQLALEKEHLLRQEIYHTDRFLQEIEDCANALCISPRLQNVMISRQQIDYLRFADCRDLLSEYVIGPYPVYRADLYLSGAGCLITSSEGVFYHLTEDERAVYDEMALAAEQGNFWTASYQSCEPDLVSRTRNTHYITLVWQVSSLYTGKPRGILLLSVPYSEFASFDAAAADEYTRILYNQEVLIGNVPDQGEWLRLDAEGGRRGFSFEYYYQFRVQQLFSWTFVMVVLVVSVLMLGSYLVIIGIAERRIARPAAHLLEGFERLEAGGFGLRLMHYDDVIFGDLNRGFDHMAEHLQTTVAELVEERTSGEQLKQELLMMQIRPHFLYNIFNNLVWLAEARDIENLEQLVYATAGFYKTALGAGTEDILLLENCEQLKYYVRIQKFRFGDRFDMEMTLTEETEMLAIPNLLLQPLVENAIVHGFQGLERRGVIRVETNVQGSELVLQVTDNGCGMNAEQLNEIRTAMERGTSNSKRFFALVNVAQRVRYRYGTEAVLTIDGAPDRGCRITLRLPLDKCNGYEG